MGIFSKQGRVSSESSATTVIAKGCVINGQLRLENDVQIDGRIEGTLNVGHTVIISESGLIKGEVFAERVIVNGIFEGTCHAGVIEILSNGYIKGTIYSDNLSIESGGRFHGVTHASEQSLSEQQVMAITDSQASNDSTTEMDDAVFDDEQLAVKN